MAAMTAPIATLPIATRAWCFRDPIKPRVAARPSKTAVEWRVPRRPERFIALDIECVTSAAVALPGFDEERWAPEDQPLLFGSADIGRTSGLRIKREIIFYPDDLPASAVAALTVYFENQTFHTVHGRERMTTHNPILHGETSAASLSSCFHYRSSSVSFFASPVRIGLWCSATEWRSSSPDLRAVGMP
jgi:hypothetical protein